MPCTRHRTTRRRANNQRRRSAVARGARAPGRACRTRAQESAQWTRPQPRGTAREAGARCRRIQRHPIRRRGILRARGIVRTSRCASCIGAACTRADRFTCNDQEVRGAVWRSGGSGGRVVVCLGGTGHAARNRRQCRRGTTGAGSRSRHGHSSCGRGRVRCASRRGKRRDRRDGSTEGIKWRCATRGRK